MRGSWLKFVNKETTTAFVSRSDSNLTFPTLAVCSDDGIRSFGNMMDKVGLPRGFWSLRGENLSDVWPQDIMQMNNLYLGSTYSKDNIVKKIRYLG